MDDAPHRYFVDTHPEDLDALFRLSSQGGDAGFLDLAEVVELNEEHEPVRWGLTQAAAWNFKVQHDEDPDAFLAGCEATRLSNALRSLIEEIV